jgi:hypothetical protein
MTGSVRCMMHANRRDYLDVHFMLVATEKTGLAAGMDAAAMGAEWRAQANWLTHTAPSMEDKEVSCIIPAFLAIVCCSCDSVVHVQALHACCFIGVCGFMHMQFLQMHSGTMFFFLHTCRTMMLETRPRYAIAGGRCCFKSGLQMQEWVAT